MTRILIAAILCFGCSYTKVQGCPPKTALVTANCKSEVAAGRMSKDECFKLIEESCP